MLKRLYDWTLAKSAHRHAERWLFLIAFLESSFFPVPPHPLLGLMCLANPHKAIRFGIICTIASVMGGLLGYAIGHFLYESVGVQLLSLLGLTKSFPVAACYLNKNAALLILAKGATPIPFKLITITAGFLGISLFTFLWASIVSRGFQFILVGILFWKFGPTIKPILEKYLGWVTGGLLVLVIAGFLAISLLGHSSNPHATDSCAGATMASVEAAR